MGLTDVVQGYVTVVVGSLLKCPLGQITTYILTRLKLPMVKS